MPRDLPIGNGHFLINFDADHRIRDIYYPYVGKENHAGGFPFRFGKHASIFLIDGKARHTAPRCGRRASPASRSACARPRPRMRRTP